MKYSELIALLESGINIAVTTIAYDEARESDDEEFLETEIISPSNDQCLIWAWVPASLSQELEDRKELVETTKYHEWESQRTCYERIIRNNVSELQTSFTGDALEKEIDSMLDEQIHNWNQTDIGTRYPIRKGIELIDEGAYEFIIKFE